MNVPGTTPVESDQDRPVAAQLDTQLLQANQLEGLGRITEGVAHDMNNVLCAILGLATANLALHAEDTKARHAFETIAQAALRGTGMMKRLLGYTSPVEVRDVDMNALLREEICLLEHTAMAKVTLELDLARTLRPIRGDPSALSNALMNLCVNAVDAMPNLGTLTLRTRNLERNRIAVSVEDTGTGMAQDILARAMDPHFTTKATGSGLGLALTQGTVKAHGGELNIQSQVGEGTCVTMSFPACP